MPIPDAVNSRPRPVRDALAEIRDYASLAAGWDSYDAAPIAGPATSAAETLLDLVQERLFARHGERIRPFAVAPIPTGGVQLEWEAGGGGRIEVEVDPGGQLGYLAVFGHGKDRRFHSEAVASPAEVVDAIAEVVELISDEPAAELARQ